MSFIRTYTDLAAKQPDIAAILAPDRAPLSFGALLARLESVRNTLNLFGIGRGDLVAIVLRNGPEMAVCCVAVTACAIAIPLNPEYTEEEFARYLARIRPKAVILPAGGGDAARKQAGTLGIPVIDLAFDRTHAAGVFELRADLRGTPDRPGWNQEEDFDHLLLTSGSTGDSKLVPWRQRGTLAFAHGFAKMYALMPSDRTINIMPMFHAHGLSPSLFNPLLVGSGVVCPERFDVPSFFALLEGLQPTWFSAGYTIHHAILNQIEPYRTVARAAGLRFIRSGSGRLEPKVMHGLEEAFGSPVVERYGMSEAGDLTCNPLPPAMRKAGAVGIPSINEVRVIDDSGAFLGPNRQGEVVARGPSVFDGYWEDPDADRAVIVDGWFRTGDVGCFDDDGYLTITGRIKDLINQGGEKLSPVEVEAVLCDHPKVAAACVFSMPHPTLGEVVVAAVVPVPNSDIGERELLAHARVGLAAFKVPRRILVCESLPKGGTGKVQRSRVAQMCRSMLAHKDGTGGDRPDGAPSDVEREILALWNAVLGTETTDLDQDFFLAGGDSLRMAELFARIRERLGVTLGLGQIFEEPATVSGIARLFERARFSGSVRRDLPAGLIPIRTDGDRPPLFALPGNGGNPLGFVHIGRLVDQRRPFYGIESRGLDGALPPLDRMEDIAADNIRRIKAMLPDGPYFLAGACFGARVAYEMARQLDAAGERIGLLLMLDPSPPFTDGRGHPRVVRAGGGGAMHFSATRFILGRVTLYARTIAALRGGERRAYLRQKATLFGEILKQRDLFRGERSELYQHATHEANLRAGRSYIPGSYNGATILCLTRDRPILSDRDYRLDWLKLVPQCGEPIYIAGRDSTEMLNLANSYVLAEQINGWLEATLADDDRDATHRTIQSAAQ